MVSDMIQGTPIFKISDIKKLNRWWSYANSQANMYSDDNTLTNIEKEEFEYYKALKQNIETRLTQLNAPIPKPEPVKLIGHSNGDPTRAFRERKLK